MLKIKIHRSIPLVLALVTTTICECSEWSEAFSLSHPFIWVQLNNTVNTQNIQQQQHYLIFPFSFPSQKEQTEEKRRDGGISSLTGSPLRSTWPSSTRLRSLLPLSVQHSLRLRLLHSSPRFSHLDLLRSTLLLFLSHYIYLFYSFQVESKNSTLQSSYTNCEKQNSFKYIDLCGWIRDPLT